MRGLFGTIGLALKDVRTLDSLPGFLMGPESKSGTSVSWSTALHVSVVLAIVKVVAEGIAQSPCRLRRPRMGGGTEDARDDDLFHMLNLQPNSWQTAFEFWETIVAHLMLVGNAFVFISRAGSGRILELIILDPGKVTVTRMADLSLRYEVMSDEGGLRSIPATEMWHIRGLSWNGWMGMEWVRLAREAIGLAIALEQSHAVLHKNGAQPSGVYSVEGPLTPDQHTMLTEWLKRFAAADVGTPMVLDRGAKWLAQQMSGVDAQHLETRRFQIEEVCRAARVMPIMAGVPGAAGAYDNGETMFIAHVTHTLLPWGVRLEQSGAVNLLTDRQRRDGWRLKFYFSAMMRGDYKSRQEGLQIQRRNGVINADEWREFEDMNPRGDAGGPQYIVEANMALQDGRDLPPPKAISTKAE